MGICYFFLCALFAKIIFHVTSVQFCANFEFLLLKQFLSIVENVLKSDFSTINGIAESEEIHSSEYIKVHIFELQRMI